MKPWAMVIFMQIKKISNIFSARPVMVRRRELPLTKTITDPNDIVFRLAMLNPVLELKVGDTVLVTEKGEPLWNTRVLSDGTYEMIGKATRQQFTFQPVMGSHCTQSGNDQSSAYCHECHSVER